MESCEKSIAILVSEYLCMESSSLKPIAEYTLFDFPEDARFSPTESKEEIMESLRIFARDSFFSPVAVSFRSDVPLAYSTVLFSLFFEECPEVAYEIPGTQGDTPQYLVVHSILDDRVTRYSNMIYVPDLFSVPDAEILDSCEIDFSTLPRVDFHSLDWLDTLRELFAELPRAKNIVFSGECDVFLQLLLFIFFRKFADTITYRHSHRIISLM